MHVEVLDGAAVPVGRVGAHTLQLRHRQDDADDQSADLGRLRAAGRQDQDAVARVVDQGPHTEGRSNGRLGLPALGLHHEVLRPVRQEHGDVVLDVRRGEAQHLHHSFEEGDELSVVPLDDAELLPPDQGRLV